MPLSARNRFLREFPAALNDDAGAVFVGAGVSRGAGYPTWNELLRDIGEELGVRSNDVHDLAALAQWNIQTSGGYTQIRKVIRENIAPDHPVPETLRIAARLPIRHLWTTNYDRLVERAFQEIGRPLDVIASAADLALRARPGAARLYKMHGSVERLDDLVISTDDYELFRSKRGAYLPLLQAHLTSMSLLFVGLSFADPNIRHVLSLIRESFTDAPPEHFALLKAPQEDEFSSKAEYEGRAVQHRLWSQDLRRYGLLAVEIESYDEVPLLLHEIERRVARRRVWISGSWPPLHANAEYAYATAEAIGSEIGNMGLALVTGAGQVVGSASLEGFLASLRRTGGWDIERRLIARPFPQPLPGVNPAKSEWTAMRQELARLSGSIIVIGGAKEADGHLVTADGVLEEIRLAGEAGSFVIPVGATGGAAQEVAQTLRGSRVPSGGPDAMRPSDADIDALADPTKSAHELSALVSRLLRRSLDM